MLLSCAPSGLLSMRALARISSDLVGCVEGAPLLRHGVGATVDEAVSMTIVLCGTDSSMPGVCEVIRVRGDAVQSEGSSMWDVANIVGWRWANQKARR